MSEPQERHQTEGEGVSLNMADCGAGNVRALLPVIDTIDLIAAGPHWTPADLVQLPLRVPVIHVADSASDFTAGVLDIETNAEHQFATIAEAPAWLAGHLAATGKVGTLYFSVGNWAAVQAECIGLEYWVWLADAHSGVKHAVDGVIATQWCSYSTLPGQANTPVPGVAFSEVVNSRALLGLPPGINW
jgi:hypothetical protein